MTAATPATPRRAYTAPVSAERCLAHAAAAAGNEGGECMHRRKYGNLCAQHAAQAYPRLLAERAQLVEALRKARNMAAAGAARCAGARHLMNPSDAEQIAKFDALLRQIGEAE